MSAARTYRVAICGAKNITPVRRGARFNTIAEAARDCARIQAQPRMRSRMFVVKEFVNGNPTGNVFTVDDSGQVQL